MGEILLFFFFKKTQENLNEYDLVMKI